MRFDETEALRPCEESDVSPDEEYLPERENVATSFRALPASSAVLPEAGLMRP